MKSGSIKCLFVIASLFAMLGAACVAQDEPSAEVQTEQASKTGDEASFSCPAKDACYAFCQARFHCPLQCDKLADCFDMCDASYPSCP